MEEMKLIELLIKKRKKVLKFWYSYDLLLFFLIFD
jgi:hypothetical protein